MIAAAIVMEKGTSLSQSNGTNSVEWIDLEVGTSVQIKAVADPIPLGKSRNMQPASKRDVLQ